MNVGMLWLDDDQKRPLQEKIKRAAEYYRRKYGRPPNCCLVTSELIQDEMTVGEVSVRPSTTILEHHFWVGIEREENGNGERIS